MERLMLWYYVDKGNKQGPFNDEDMKGLVRDGKIMPNTPVWRSGMSGWKTWESAKRATANEPAINKVHSLNAKTAFCTECGKEFLQDNMVHFENAWICGHCKPLFFQKLKEGVSMSHVVEYGGFWIRLVAKIIDTFIVSLINLAIIVPLSLLFNLGLGIDENLESFSAILVSQGIIALLQVIMVVGYSTFFIGKYDATPGKMACDLKVVTSDIGKVSYKRAIYRAFGEMLSAVFLNIGYIVAAFSDEKITLHDYLCNTRVIKEQK